MCIDQIETSTSPPGIPFLMCPRWKLSVVDIGVWAGAQGVGYLTLCRGVGVGGWWGVKQVALRSW